MTGRKSRRRGAVCNPLLDTGQGHGRLAPGTMFFELLQTDLSKSYVIHF